MLGNLAARADEIEFMLKQEVLIPNPTTQH
jgi:hypothetical protein